MEQGALLARIEKILPGVVLQKQRFGRGGELSIWVETKSLYLAAHALRSDPEIQADWLEHLSVMQVEEALVATYVLRSTSGELSLLLRVSVVPPTSEAEAELPSTAAIWPMAAPMERELAELFGIKFLGSGDAPGGSPSEAALRAWGGYPLRKGYKFPTEVLGIQHHRPTARKGGDAGGSA